MLDRNLPCNLASDVLRLACDVEARQPSMGSPASMSGLQGQHLIPQQPKSPDQVFLPAKFIVRIHQRDAAKASLQGQ